MKTLVEIKHDACYIERFNDTESKAYRKGYDHGYLDGIENNPYDHADINRTLYKQGYDAGVHDYCREFLDERLTLNEVEL